MIRASVLIFALAASALSIQDQGPTAKPFTVRAHRYAFEPARIEVNQDDLVKIELRTDDIAHSLTIDDYRIAKRVGPGPPVTFEFRADRAGTFPYYCNLQVEDGCRQMRGVLVVKARTHIDVGAGLSRSMVRRIDVGSGFSRTMIRLKAYHMFR